MSRGARGFAWAGRAATALALLLAATARAQPAPTDRAQPAPPCHAESRIEPPRAFVGQQVLHRTVLLAPAGATLEWTRPAQFPGFRAEALGPGSTTTATAPPAPGTAGAPLRIESVTALFAVRAGRWRLPDAHLRCGDGPEQRVPGPAFEALPPPTGGRPADWTGVVGVVAISAEAPAAAVLGEAVRIHVTTRGAANLWDAAPRLSLDPPDTELFARPPRIVLHGDERLRVVRHDVFDLVPRRPGTVRVAPVRIAYFEPERAGFDAAQSAPLEIAVRAAAPAAGPVPRAEAAAGRADGRGWIPAAAALAAAVLAAGAAVGLARRRARARDPARDALREADRARDPTARAAALERGLRARLEGYARDPAALGRSPEAAARCREALARLERARWDGTHQALDLEEVRAALAHSLRS